jgi:Flp pilus assembly protein TadG
MARMKRTTRKGDRRGAALVEMAIVAQLMIVLVMGVIEYSWCLLKCQQLSNAARVGARAGARYGATSTDITSAVSSAMTAAGMSSSGYTLTTTPANPSTLAAGALLTVQVSVPYANVDAVGIVLIPTPTTIKGKVVMAREGP